MKSSWTRFCANKYFYATLSITALVAYGFFVQAAVVTYNPGETLDPTDPSCQADNNCYVVIPGATIGSSVLGGTPNQVLYTDADGKVFGDSQFTRDSTTGNTNIGVANGVVAANMSILNTGNTITWDADTTDDIVDQIIQSTDVLGSGSPGTALARYDSGTSEKAILGTSQFAGVISVFGSATNPDDTITSNMTMSANAAGGFGFTYEDTNTNQRSRFRMNTDDGNLWQFTPNILGNIETTLEQNNDILGLGILSGSALTWSDSSTQIHAIVGAVDATAAGLYPGSTLIATNNLATGASASIATNYDNVLNIATVIANAGNGDFDSGLEFDDGRMVVRYRNQTTGFESAFEADASGAVTRYKLDTLTNEYSTQLSNGVFQFFNSTTAAQYMSLGANTGIFQLGDISDALNSTVFIVNDTAKTINANVDGVFTVEDGSASSIMYIDAANRQSIFGNISNGGGIKMFIDDVTGINVQAPGGVVNVGANTFGNETNISVDDVNQAITFGYTGSSYTFPIGDGATNYLLATDGAGQLFWQDPTLVPSDASLKSNIQSLTYGLDTLMQLNPVSYTLNSSNKEQIGFIAQEVESLVPELVGEVANGKKGLAYGQMTAVIVKSIQEMNLKISDIDT